MKMKKTIEKFIYLLKTVLSYFPTSLPRGAEDFDAWSDSIISMAGSPNNDSVKFTLAVMILHLDPSISKKPKQDFVRLLHKAMSNQVVSQIINDLKEKQKAEATALKEAVSNVDEPKGV
jgi:hypothetical protein